MKITRITSIREHRIFRNFQWTETLPDFGRYNVIFGWNGAGKTTLSNIFRHLQTKQPIAEGDVKYVIGQWTVRSSDETSVIPQVRVFNRDSVDRAVFDRPGNQLSPIYFLGEDTVEK